MEQAIAETCEDLRAARAQVKSAAMLAAIEEVLAELETLRERLASP